VVRLLHLHVRTSNGLQRSVEGLRSTHHQLPRHQAASPHSLRFIHEVHHTQYVHMGYWQVVD
jgi:hypothetical protein